MAARRPGVGPRLRTYVALGITVVWAVSYLAAIATSMTGALAVGTPVALIAVGYLLAADVVRGDRK